MNRRGFVGRVLAGFGALCAAFRPPAAAPTAPLISGWHKAGWHFERGQWVYYGEAPPEGSPIRPARDHSLSRP